MIRSLRPACRARITSRARLALVLTFLAALDACGGGTGASASRGASAGIDLGNPSSGSADWPNFTEPRAGDPNVAAVQAIQWTAVTGARAYQLQLGTAPDGNDVFDSGIVSSTSVPMPPLPAGKVIYARVRAVLKNWSDTALAGHWLRGSYITFRADDNTPASVISNVSNGQGPADGVPLEWNPVPLALGYRVILSTADPDAATQVYLGTQDNPSGDSGLMHTTHIYFNAPAGASVMATLETIYLDRTVSSNVQFTASGGTPSFADRYAFAKRLTAEVRLMADRDNQPFGTTLLHSLVLNFGLSSASCTEYRMALLELLEETQAGLTTRQLDIALQANGYDTHTLAEILDPSTGRWLTLDPTFGLVTLLDGAPATAVDISEAARGQDWTRLSFEYLTNDADLHALDYYIDYPLLYLNVHSSTSKGFVATPPATLAAYFDPVDLPLVAPRDSYALVCPAGTTSASALVDSVDRQLPCGGNDELTGVFLANRISADGSVPRAWHLRRFVF